MPPKSAPVMSLPGYQEHFLTQAEKWNDVMKTDPRRVCRALLLTTPRGETIEGDTFDDLPILFEQVKAVSRQSTSKVWKGLVDAGIITSLCKCAINFEASIGQAYVFLNDDGTAELSQEGMDFAQENAPAPYSAALEILCNAAVSCAVPPTSTEQKMIEELKKYWSTITQRIWSDPSRTLEPGSERNVRAKERVVVAQIAHRLSFVDPTFLDVILKPSDLTLAVCFRYWLYSTEEYDAMANCSLIAPLLDGMGPEHWKRYFAQHPLPDMHSLLPRILLGASRGAEKKKRTPNQAADFIVSTFASHFRRFKDRYLNEEFIFFTGLLNAAMKEYPSFHRALYRSEPFWSVMAAIITENEPLPPNAPKRGYVPEGLTMAALSLYFNVLHTPDAQEHMDSLMYSWIAGGLFDALESAITTIIRSVRGPMLISALFSTLDTNLPRLSAKTRSKLRSELPRPRLMLTLILLATRGRQEPEILLALVTESESIMRSPLEVHDPRHPVWSATAWQLLLRVTNSMRPYKGTCTRRGCENPAYSGGCGRCKFSAYCGQECMSRDREHLLICKWVPTLMIVDMYQKRNKEEMLELLGDGVAPEPPSDLVPLDEQMRRLQEAGEFTEDDVAKLMEMQRESQENASKPDDPIPGVTDVQKAMEKMRISGGA